VCTISHRRAAAAGEQVLHTNASGQRRDFVVHDGELLVHTGKVGLGLRLEVREVRNKAVHAALSGANALVHLRAEGRL
jgi:hypothetical protein